MALKLQLLSIFLFLPLISFSQTTEQDSILQWWFPISIEETEKIIDDNSVLDTWNWSFEKATSFPEKKEDKDVLEGLPFGQYLKVEASKSDIKIDIKYHSYLDIGMIDNGKNKWIVIVDQNGNRLKVDELIQGRKVLKYDKKYKGYAVNRTRNDQLIICKYDGLINYYYLSKEDRYREFGDGWRWFKRTKIGQVIIVKPKYFFKRLFSWRKRYNDNDDNYRNYHPSFNGYVALNQPKFSYNDTLKVKGYFIKQKNGKPYNKPLELIIGEKKDYYTIDTIQKIELNPDVPGRFLYDFVINDSLKIDKEYKIIFQFKGNQKNERWVKEFYLEEYELDDVEYTLETTKTSYKKGDKIILKANAKYTTGKRVPNANIKLKLTAGRVEEFLVDSLLIPNILWEHTHELKFTDETQIIIPDSILPNARMGVKIQAEFSTFNGELQSKNIAFFINEESGIETEGELFLSYESGYIKGEYKVNDTIVETNVILEKLSQKGKVAEEIQVPFEIKYNPFLTGYSIKKGKKFKSLSSYNIKDDAIQVLGNKLMDSIFIQVQNSYELPIHYALLYGKKIIEEGIINDTLWTFEKQSKGDDNYTISYSYNWLGSTERKTKSFQLNKNILNITIEQAEEAEPGEEIDVKIKVADQAGKPVKNVELIAASLSSKFNKDFSKSFDAPRTRSQKSKYPKWKKKVKIQQSYYSKYGSVRKVELTDNWFDKLNLYSSVDFRFRFPENGIHMEYVPIPENKSRAAQFIPLVTKKGRYRNVFSIHYNRKPIYYYDTDIGNYVFIGESGEQDITIRLDNKKIIFKNIELREGYKLIFSIDEEYIKVNHIDNVSLQFMPNKWNHKELQERARSLMYVHKNFIEEMYLWQYGRQVYYLSQYGNNKDGFLVGPFEELKKLQFIRQKKYIKTLEFEGGFRYEIEKNRERLYFYDFVKKDKETIFSSPYFNPNIHAFALTSNEVEFIPASEFKKPSEPFAHLYGNRLLDYDNKSKLNIKYSGIQPLATALINTKTKDNYVFSPRKRNIQNLPNGKYEILFIFEYGYLSSLIDIKDNHQSYLRINNDSGRLTANNFKEKVKTAFGPDFIWEESIFVKSEAELLGMFDQLNQKDFTDLIEKAKKNGKKYIGAKKIVSGIVLLEENGEAIGANVVVDGDEGIGTVTEFDGTFSLEIPYNATHLKVSYTGFTTRIVDVERLNAVVVTLGADGLILQNVVVTGYSTMKKSNLTSSVSVITSSDSLSSLDDALQGRISGIQITNANGKSGNAEFLRIRGASSLNSSNEPLYIINGIPVSANVMKKLNPNEINEISVLKDEAATAIYGSKAIYGAIIITTVDGAVIPTEAEAITLQGFQIRENFSDYAYWQPRLVTNENGEAFFTTKLPDDITGWQTYVLGLDQKNRAGAAFHTTMSYKKLMAELSVPRFAIEGDTFNIIGQSVNYTQDSFLVNTTFKVDDEIIQNQSSTIVSSLAEQIEVVAPINKDSLHFQYELSNKQYGDGEKRDLPIFKKGTTEHIGEFRVLNNNETFQFKGIENQPINISIQDNSMDVLLESLNYLKNYRYGCAEQTSSKLIALLLEKDLNQKLGLAFTDEAQILKNIIRLNDMQNEEGSWGWWKGNKGVSWITLYVIEALQMANQAGFETLALEDGLDFIAQKNHLTRSAHQLKAMNILIKDGTTIDSLEVVKYDTIDLKLPDYLLYNKVKQQLGYQYDLDSIQKLLIPTTYGALHMPNQNKYWYYDNINTTLLAYDIFKSANKKDITDDIELYFYTNKKSVSWNNTIQTAQILKRLIPNVEKLNIDSKIFIEDKEIKEFPYQVQSNKNTLTIRQEGIAPYFVDLSQEIHKPNPEAKKDVFEVQTYFIQESNKTAYLKKSTPTQLIVEVNAKQEGDYIMLEIPIPAACSYGTKTSRNSDLNLGKARRGQESHREYHKEKVVIFCKRLPKGINTFTIHLEPRYTGTYTLNPVRVEEMYAPTIYGRNKLQSLKVN